jgi:hypothetical protein
MNGRQAHRAGTLVLSLAMVAIGVTLAAEAIGEGGIISARLLLGLLFLAGGSGRLYIEKLRRDRGA